MEITKNLYFFTIVFIIVLFDQLTKNIIRIYQTNKTFVIFKITFVQNFGMGFGLLNFPNFKWILIIITIIIIIGLLFYYSKLKSKSFIPFLSLALILGGALGNLIDRITFGFVIDFIDFGFWPAFNIADSAITIGVILLIFFFWKQSYNKKKKIISKKIKTRPKISKSRKNRKI